MTKLTLTPVSNLSNGSAVGAINENYDRIEAAFENVLSRNGDTPNQMGADIDLNSNDLLNVNELDATVLKVGGVNIGQRVQDALTAAIEAEASAVDALASETNAAVSATLAKIAADQADNRRDYSTKISAQSSNIPANILYIRVAGDTVEGGVGGGTFVDTDNGSKDTFVSGDGRTWYRAFDTITQTNPNSPGWNVSFNPPAAPGYSNGMARTYIVNGNTPNPVNGWLLNYIVESSYDKDIMGAITTSPVAVGINVGMQVQKANAGNDFWPLLGVLDIQAAGTAGQATSGILRGNWTGTNIAAGLRAQGENYSGRAGYGLIVSASLTDGLGAYFDNSFANGVFVHMARDFGVRVGGLQGAQQALLPDKPFVFQTADGSQDIWSIVNNGGLTATMRLQGAFTLESGTLPLIQIGNVGAAADQKNWQMFGAADGTFQIRTLNDAQNFAETVFQINRTGAVFDSISFGGGKATIDKGGYINALSGIRVGGNQVLGGRDTGWTAMTGGVDRNGALDTSTVTLAQLAARVSALQTALTIHGLIGA